MSGWEGGCKEGGEEEEGNLREMKTNIEEKTREETSN